MIICKDFLNGYVKTFLPFLHIQALLRCLPVISKCWRFVHFVAKSNSEWFVTVELDWIWRWVSSGHRLLNNCTPRSDTRHPSLNITRSTFKQDPFLVCPHSLRKIVFNTLSPDMPSPFNVICFHSTGLQTSDSNRRHTLVILHRSQLSNQLKIFNTTSSDRRSKPPDRHTPFLFHGVATCWLDGDGETNVA